MCASMSATDDADADNNLTGSDESDGEQGRDGSDAGDDDNDMPFLSRVPTLELHRESLKGVRSQCALTLYYNNCWTCPSSS